MRIELPTGTAAELCSPTDGSAPARGLVLWPDIFGLRPLFVDHAQRLADANGWAVCCLEVFPGQESLPIEERHAAAALLRDVDKASDAVAAADACGVEPVGVMGFCMGGMYAMKSLATHRFDRSVAFYGMVRTPAAWRPADGSAPTQGDALDAVRARGDAELLCIFGTEDPWCPLDQIDEVEAAGARVVRYVGADHGWAQDPDRENYRRDDAADAWRRAVEFLRDGPR